MVHLYSSPARPTVKGCAAAGPGHDYSACDMSLGASCDATLSEKVLDIAKAQSEPMVQPDGMADDLGWKAVASIQ